MNIKQLQKLVHTEGWLMSDKVKMRIMNDKMTLEDIKFMENTIMSMRMIQVKYDLEVLVPVLQEASMSIIELKNQGENVVDLDYTLNVLNDLTDHFVGYQELFDDFGLADVQAHFKEEKK